MATLRYASIRIPRRLCPSSLNNSVSNSSSVRGMPSDSTHLIRDINCPWVYSVTVRPCRIRGLGPLAPSPPVDVSRCSGFSEVTITSSNAILRAP